MENKTSWGPLLATARYGIKEAVSDLSFSIGSFVENLTILHTSLMTKNKRPVAEFSHIPSFPT